MKTIEEEIIEENEPPANILIAGINSDGQIIFVNEECEKSTGYSSDQLIGRSFWDLAPSDAGEGIESVFSGSAEELPSSLEMPWIAEDGEEHDIVWELIQFRRSESDIGMIVAAGIDSTVWKHEREDLENRLEEFKQIYHELAAESLIGVFIIQPTPEGLVIRFANSELANMFGFEKDELLGKSFGNLIHPDYISEIEERIKEIKEEKEGKIFKVKGRKKNNEEFWLKNRLSFITYEGNPALLGMAEEVKMEKRTEQEEDENDSEKYKAIADFAKVGLGIIQDGDIVYLNDQMAKNFECSKEELHELGFSHFVHPEDKEELEITFQDKIPREKLPYTSSYRVITKEGKVKYLSLHATEVEYEGRPATQLVIKDVTEQKETEKRLRDQRKELRQAYKHLRETESKLTRKTKELRRANEMRAKFMDVLAHELRSYLTPVGAYIGTIKLGELGEVSSEQKQKLEEASKKLDKIDQLVEDTLDLSRMEADRVKLSSESIFLPDMIDEIVGDFEPEIDDKNHQLVTDISEDVPVIEGDPRLLEKVFSNLISNAIQYTPEDGRIEVEVSQARNNGVHFKVKDTGIGIPEEEQDKIFEKFYRVKENSNDEPRGLGMGLAMAKHFVELHGGEIWVESDVGEGSTFHVKLPKKKESSEK